MIPHTLNLDEADESSDNVDLVRGAFRAQAIDAALSNSFGFGGTNVSLLFQKA